MARRRDEGYIPASYAGILRYREDDLKRHLVLKPEQVLTVSIVVGLLVLILTIVGPIILP